MDEGKGEFVKNQQCKKATRICKLNSFSDNTQKWKLNNKKLENKAGVSKSDDLWIFKTKDGGMISIENQNPSKAKVLGATSNGKGKVIKVLGATSNGKGKVKVIPEVLDEGKADQLWKKGELDAEGYFTLQNSGETKVPGEPKVLTAVFGGGLEIKGIR